MARGANWETTIGVRPIKEASPRRQGGVVSTFGTDVLVLERGRQGVNFLPVHEVRPQDGDLNGDGNR